MLGTHASPLPSQAQSRPILSVLWDDSSRPRSQSGLGRQLQILRLRRGTRRVGEVLTWVS